MTRRRKLGGLGPRVARHHNTALLGKVVWDILDSRDKLWVSMLKDLYIKGGNIFNAVNVKGSPTWNPVRQALKVLHDGFELKIGTGNTSFWYSPWVIKSPLCGKVSYVDIHDLNLKIKDVWNGNNWNLSMLYTPLSNEICESICNLNPWLDEDVPDVWVWKNSITGLYSVKDAYHWLMDDNGSQGNDVSWRWIWRLKVSANIQFFIWQLCHRSIPTRSVLK